MTKVMILSIDTLTSMIKAATKESIANQIAQLIKTGNISVGTFLPATEELAKSLNVNPRIISEAWRILKKQDLVSILPGVGVLVINQFNNTSPQRLDDFNLHNKTIRLDLSSAQADPHLLPDIKPAIINSLSTLAVASEHEHLPIIESLKKTVSTCWPYASQNFLVLNHNLEGINFLLKNLSFFNSSVALENPSVIGVLDLCRQFNIKTIPVNCDASGPCPQHLLTALKKKPTVFILQVRSQIPSNYSLTQARLKELATVLESYPDTFIIENDIVGDISDQPVLSLGQFFPERTIHLRSYHKIYGYEVGMSVMSAPEVLIQKFQQQRSYTTNSFNPLLQNILNSLINDPDTQAQVKKAQQIYKNRLTKLIEAIKKYDIHLTDHSDGLCLWLPVPYERHAVMTLARHGVLVIGGGHFMVNQQKQGYIRLSVTRLGENDIEFIAQLLGEVANDKINHHFELQKLL